ncbi:uncharacterized protein LOC111320004 [Stylophora pistillata]|uniref:Uncharacterized protein n=1 Tax=Stylophora pistillata TaxID=50429 RepID=A0A2B4SRW7_STYPI|nr:uncharacterized protein LOC111320004 [Stylophora pistillata]PFX32641.1 hypothetical protein AWC38_SpisGene2499 [Stylophora pistillata]
MSHSPSPLSSSESYYSHGESEPKSFPEKPLLEIGGYDDSVEPVPTEEDAALYLEQLALEEEDEQILLSRFSGEEDIGDWFTSIFISQGEHVLCSDCLLKNKSNT